MTEFKIAAAQVPSVRGQIELNIRTHASTIEAAAQHHIAVLVFPELSLIGYEPDLATSHALSAFDVRLTPLVELANRHQMHVIVGASLLAEHSKPTLGAIVIRPNGAPQTYSKMRLGGAEPNYFAPGRLPFLFDSHGQKIGLSICADSAEPSHPRNYAERGATVYAAGVFLNAEWHATDAPRLASYAPVHRMLVLMANHGDSVGTHVSIGKSAVWAPDGALLAQVTGTQNALVIATRAQESWRGEVIEF